MISYKSAKPSDSSTSSVSLSISSSTPESSSPCTHSHPPPCHMMNLRCSQNHSHHFQYPHHLYPIHMLIRVINPVIIFFQLSINLHNKILSRIGRGRIVCHFVSYTPTEISHHHIMVSKPEWYVNLIKGVSLKKKKIRHGIKIFFNDQVGQTN